MENFIRPVRISYDEAVHLARQVLTKYGPDHRDNTEFGQYFNDDGSASCMVGAMLDEKGVTATSVRLLGCNNATTFSLQSAGVLMAADLRTELFLRTLQIANDNGEKWQFALRLALESTDGDVSLARPLDPEPVKVGYVSREDLMKTAENFLATVESYQEKPLAENKTEVLEHAVVEHVLVA